MCDPTIILFRKLRFREPVDDRSPEPNNNEAENSFEEDLPETMVGLYLSDD